MTLARYPLVIERVCYKTPCRTQRHYVRVPVIKIEPVYRCAGCGETRQIDEAALDDRARGRILPTPEIVAANEMDRAANAAELKRLAMQSYRDRLRKHGGTLTPRVPGHKHRGPCGRACRDGTWRNP